MILLCAAKENRDADHLQNFVYDQCAGLDADKLAADLQNCRKPGKTKAEFFRDEQAALEPFQPGLFDDLPES